MRNSKALVIGPRGATLAAGAASASVAIPNDSSGTRAAYIRVASTGNAHIELGISAATATTTSMLLCAGEPEILAVGGNTHIAAIQSGTATSVNIIPVEEM